MTYLKRNLYFSLLVVFFSVLLSCYWLLPQAYAIFRNVELGIVPKLRDQCLAWLQGTSMHTGLFNVIRLQGDWTWYAGHGDPYRTYSQLYQNNIFMICLSWLAPILVLYGIIFGRSKYKPLFISLTIMGIILCMGVHKPFGYIYIWMVKRIPLFWVVRSPYFKFGTFICLGYAFFIGIGCARIYEYICNKKAKFSNIIGVSIISAIVCLNIVYAFPVATGKMYSSQKERTLLPPDRAKIPHYVLSTAEYLYSQDRYSRIFCVPTFNPQMYRWGFNSFEPVLSQFVPNPLVFKYNIQYILTAQASQNMAEEIVDYIEEVLYNKKTEFICKLFRMLGVRYVLQQNDIRYDFFGGWDSPLFIKTRLHKQRGIDFCKKYGEWDVYKVEEGLPHIFVTDKATLINGGFESFAPLTNTEILNCPCLIMNNEQNSQIVKKLSSQGQFKEIVFYNPKAEDIGLKKNSVVGRSIFYFSTFEMDKVPFKGEAAVEASNLKIVDCKGFHDLEKWNDGWYWLKTNMEPNLVIRNTTDNLISSNLYFEVYNYGIEKELCIYFDNKFFRSYKLKENEIKSIVVNDIEFMPGENVLLFYTAYQHSYRDDIAVNFGFKNFQLCKLKFNGEIYVPKDSKYEIKVYPTLSDGNFDSCRDKVIKFDAQILELVPYSVGERFWFGKKDIFIKKGKHDISINQKDYENYYIEFCQNDIVNEVSENILPKISYRKISPARYEVKIDSPTSSFMLILCEAYHPLWAAYIDNKKVENHFSVNGYANGYLIEKKGKFTINLEFYPQRLAIFGRWISFIGLILAVIICFLRFSRG